MDLLKQLLEKDPSKRPTATQAMAHDAFLFHLSKSPLLVRPSDSQNLQKFKQLTEQNGLKPKAVNVVIPDRIEDLSPYPAPKTKF